MRRWVPGFLVVPLAFAVAKLVLHAVAAPNWGYFRDELYYLACARHLAWGYVDQPPLSIAVLALVRRVLGESLWALRAATALVGAANVVWTGLIARELGGSRLAQALACLAAVTVPIWLGVDHLFTMNAFDTFFWTLSAWLLLRSLERGRALTWLALGVTLGLGLMNKTSMLWFIGGATLGVLLTPERRALLTKWPWLALTIAGAIFAPYVGWELRHHWPTLEFMRNATQHKMVRTSLGEFWSQQLLVMGPAAAPLWLGGLVALLRTGGRQRVLGVVFLATAGLLLASGASRPNYLAVAYAPLFAAGAVVVERWAARRRWVGFVAVGVVLLDAALVPVALPLQSVGAHIAYTRALGIHQRPQEHAEESDLPQVFADMFGWEELVSKVAGVYRSLPEEDRARAAIFAVNYGEAAAIDFFGPKYGLPPAISSHNNYWLWGPHGATGQVVIIVGGRRDDPHADFRSAVLADTTSCQHCMPYENGAPIFVCRDLNEPLTQRWQEIRNFN